MKINKADYDVLKNAIEQALGTGRSKVEIYRREGLTPMRFRWDMLWQSGIQLGQSHNKPESGDKTWLGLYDYANDDHIDTALRKIMRENGLGWAAQK